MRLIALSESPLEKKRDQRSEPPAASGHMQETLGLAFAGKHPLV